MELGTNPKSDVCLICEAACVCDWLVPGTTEGPRGGAELQVGLVARGLLERGQRVALVVPGGGATPSDGWPHRLRRVEFVPRPARGLGHLVMRWPVRQVLALAKANSRVYYQRSLHPGVLVTALFCRATGRRFYYGVASRADVDGTWARWYGASKFLGALMDAILRRADGIIAQNQEQGEIIRRRLGRNATVIPNLAAPIQAPDRLPGDTVVWIGRAFPIKRPDLLAELIRGMPDTAFRVVLQRHDGPEQGALLEATLGLPNATFVPPVPAWRVGELYAGAGLLLCTSDLEGFPNTFLDAWQLGIPVVTRYDPGGVVVRKGLGWVARDVPALKAAIREALAHPQERARRGRQGQEYVDVYHSARSVVPRYCHEFGLADDSKAHANSVVSQRC